MDQQNTILDLRNVVKRFGGITASNNISIHVPQGSIYGVVGPNGAGKTTLFNMITGVYDTTEGEIVFDGEKINGLPTHIIAQKGIARTFQNIRLFGDLSVYDNLLTACQKNITYSLFDGFLRTPNCRRQEKAARAECDALLEEMELTTQSGQKASNLPYGMQRKLEIARALATHPKVLLLDEPAAGMNEEESVQLSAFIRNIRDSRDLTIVIIDHHMDVIMSICDRVSVLNFGTLLADGEPSEIQSNPELAFDGLGAIDEGKTAFFCQRDGQRVVGNGLHDSGDQRDVQRDRWFFAFSEFDQWGFEADIGWRALFGSEAWDQKILAKSVGWFVINECHVLTPFKSYREAILINPDRGLGAGSRSSSCPGRR